MFHISIQRDDFLRNYAEIEEVGPMPDVSKLSTKGQVTIPAAIRKALRIVPGDRVAYELQGEAVTLRKVDPFDAAYHSAVGETLGEWNSPEDEEAFNDL